MEIIKAKTHANSAKKQERESLAIFNATPYPNNEKGRDGRMQDGTSYEFKSLMYSAPSIGGKYVTDHSHDVRTAIAYYMSHAEWLAVRTDENTILWMDRAEAINWLYERASLNRTSTDKGSHWILRLNHNPRTAKATAKLLAEGFTL
jgi:hypothetical protein